MSAAASPVSGRCITSGGLRAHDSGVARDAGLVIVPALMLIFRECLPNGVYHRYKIAATTSPPALATTDPPPAAPLAKAGSSPAAPKPHSGETYWLQAGAFTEEREADNLKAKIALTGLEASVRPVSIPDKVTLYRVRLGPYQSLDDANRIKGALTQNGVGAAIIRTTDEAKKQ